jgi:hypothetical protein
MPHSFEQGTQNISYSMYRFIKIWAYLDIIHIHSNLDKVKTFHMGRREYFNLKYSMINID